MILNNSEHALADPVSSGIVMAEAIISCYGFKGEDVIITIDNTKCISSSYFNAFLIKMVAYLGIEILECIKIQTNSDAIKSIYAVSEMSVRRAHNEYCNN